jgi:PadR family transcriptional regulator
MTTLRLTRATRLVAAHLLAHPGGDHGYAIARATGLDRRALTGTHGLLRRLEVAGYATREVEQVDPHTAGRPPRHVYRLTDQGRAWAARIAPQPSYDAAARGGKDP